MKQAIVFISVLVLGYLCGAFVAGDFNSANWDVGGKAALAYGTFFGGVSGCNRFKSLGERMKTDRELLELAAKAAGYDFTEWSDKISDHDSPHYGMPALHKSGVTGQCCSFNALLDDGDCARLEVACGLRVTVCSYGVLSEWLDTLVAKLEVHEGHGGDRDKTRRRASVQVAAMIGEAMP